MEPHRKAAATDQQSLTYKNPARRRVCTEIQFFPFHLPFISLRATLKSDPDFGHGTRYGVLAPCPLLTSSFAIAWNVVQKDEDVAVNSTLIPISTIVAINPIYSLFFNRYFLGSVAIQLPGLQTLVPGIYPCFKKSFQFPLHTPKNDGQHHCACSNQHIDKT